MKSRTLVLAICSGLFFLCATLGIVAVKNDPAPPQIIFTTPPQIIKRDAQIPLRLLSAKNIDIDDVQIYAVQGNTRERILPAAFGPKLSPVHELAISLAASEKLLDGNVDIEIKARSNNNLYKLNGLLAPFWTKESFSLTADLSLPSAQWTWSNTPVTRGSAAVLSLTSSEALSFIHVDGCEPPQVAPRRYAIIVGFPHNAPLSAYTLGLHLTDTAGNNTKMEIKGDVEDFIFSDDLIWITNSFLKNKNEEFRLYTGNTEASALELFLIMNRQERKNSYQSLKELCQKSVPKKLWNGPFLPMPGAVRRSNFADKRSYVYKNEVIDQQVHLGLDYASVVKDKIPASNSGRIAFSGYLGIHGNAVLIDHGFGLFSLYSHLSEIEAQKGAFVEKGQIIGRTGTTGMAGGDHLHFEILAGGTSLNPDLFFDAHWLAQNIEEPLSHFMEAGNE